MKPVRIGVISFNIWMTGASDAIDRAEDRQKFGELLDGLAIAQPRWRHAPS
jgi:carbamoylphosphate synthase large subunit